VVFKVDETGGLKTVQDLGSRFDLLLCVAMEEKREVYELCVLVSASLLALKMDVTGIERLSFSTAESAIVLLLYPERL
jgi:hypothetical protein